MTLLDLIYAAAPYVAVAIVAANWRAIMWLVRTLFCKTPAGVRVPENDQPKEN
jgi:hypothetical protein